MVIYVKYCPGRKHLQVGSAFGPPTPAAADRSALTRCGDVARPGFADADDPVLYGLPAGPVRERRDLWPPRISGHPDQIVRADTIPGGRVLRVGKGSRRREQQGGERDHRL